MCWVLYSGESSNLVLCNSKTCALTTAPQISSYTGWKNVLSFSSKYMVTMHSPTVRDLALYYELPEKHFLNSPQQAFPEVASRPGLGLHCRHWPWSGWPRSWSPGAYGLGEGGGGGGGAREKTKLEKKHKSHTDTAHSNTEAHWPFRQSSENLALLTWMSLLQRLPWTLWGYLAASLNSTH